MEEFKAVVYSHTTQNFNDAKDEFTSSELCEKYPQLHSYFETHVMPNEEAWASAYRRNLPVRGNNTQNYVEAQLRLF